MSKARKMIDVALARFRKDREPKNKHELAFDEWTRAAGTWKDYGTPQRFMKLQGAWKRGEDPITWRGR